MGAMPWRWKRKAPLTTTSAAAKAASTSPERTPNRMAVLSPHSGGRTGGPAPGGGLVGDPDQVQGVLGHVPVHGGDDGHRLSYEPQEVPSSPLSPARPLHR